MRCESKSGKHAPSVETRSNDKYSVFYAIRVLMPMDYTVLFYCIFYAVIRQISMLFIDNKDSVFCILRHSLLKNGQRQTNRRTAHKGPPRSTMPHLTLLLTLSDHLVMDRNYPVTLVVTRLLYTETSTEKIHMCTCH